MFYIIKPRTARIYNCIALLILLAIGTKEVTASDNPLLPPEFSHSTGFYDEPVILTITHPDTDAVIYYTLDGSVPDQNAYLYNEPLTFTDTSSQPNNFSVIPTNAIDDGSFRAWREPSGLVRKAHTVRAIALSNGQVSAPVSATYFIFDDGRRYDLPVLSIISDSLDFFGYEQGIYVPGEQYIEGDHSTGNYMQRGIEWEREVHLEMMEPDGAIVLQQHTGVRIHGGFTRRFPQKSLRLYARSDYGESRFNHTIFPAQEDSSYNRLILRNSGNDFAGTALMDATAQSLVTHFNMDTQAYRPAVLFLNGEFWGIHNIRERYDKHYLERVYGVDPDNVDILTGRHFADEGDAEHYNEMFDYATENDLSDPVHFDEMRRRMDMDNYLDYYSAQVYFGNNDWPHNNIDYWRYRVPFNPNAPAGHDGRWRWLLYDVDSSLGHNTDETFDMIEWILLEINPTFELEWPNQLFRNLMENESFYRDFINRVTDHLNTAFQGDRVSGIIDSLKTPIAAVIEENITRWPNFGSVGSWENRIQRMHDYAERRPDYVREHMQQHLETGEQKTITVDVSHPHKGYVQINSLTLKPETPGVNDPAYPWSGIYFENIPVTLKAVPAYGYRFSHWETGLDLPDLATPRDLAITVSLGDQSSVTAHFVPDDEGDRLIHFWLFSDDLPNNTPLEVIPPTLSRVDGASLTFEPAISPYPPASGTEGIMDRVNDPTKINYFADELGFPFEDSGMRGIRVRNPSLVNNRESAIVLDLPTTGFSEPVLSFAAVRTGNGQRELTFEYHLGDEESEEQLWTSAGLSKSSAIMYEQYKLVNISFRGIEGAADNPDFRFRIRFSGDEDIRQGDDGNVRFNNIALWNNESGFERVPELAFLIQPSENGIHIPVETEFIWSDADRARSFIFQLSRDSSFAHLLMEQTVIRESHINRNPGQIKWKVEEQLEHETTYYWRVRAVNEVGSSPWSEIRSFTTSEEVYPEITMLPNFPNPFRDATRIAYHLPDEEAIHVTLEIFDILGRRVAVLVDEEQSRGVHQVEFDGTGFTSGVYLYRIRAGGVNQTEKMLLIR